MTDRELYQFFMSEFMSEGIIPKYIDSNGRLAAITPKNPKKYHEVFWSSQDKHTSWWNIMNEAYSDYSKVPLVKALS